MKQPTLVIEHCEKTLSPWLLLEYKHAVNIWKKPILFTNINNKKTEEILKKIATIDHRLVKDIFPKKTSIILDPQAKKPLTTTDFTNLDALIVGGILGYEEPQGRTKELISDTTPFKTRHLGKKQLTIDSAVLIAKAICYGLKLQDIEITTEIEIIHDAVHSTILPFGYPIIDDTPLITPGLVDYIRTSLFE